MSWHYWILILHHPIHNKSSKSNLQRRKSPVLMFRLQAMFPHLIPHKYAEDHISACSIFCLNIHLWVFQHRRKNHLAKHIHQAPIFALFQVFFCYSEDYLTHVVLFQSLLVSLFLYHIHNFFPPVFLWVRWYKCKWFRRWSTMEMQI